MTAKSLCEREKNVFGKLFVKHRIIDFLSTKHKAESLSTLNVCSTKVSTCSSCNFRVNFEVS